MNCLNCGNILLKSQKKYCCKKCAYKYLNSLPERKQKEKERRYKNNIHVKKEGDLYDKNGPLNPNWKGGISKNKIQYVKKYLENNRYKHNVGQMTYRAIKKGKLIRSPCIVCNDIKTDAHHEDYEKPYDIIWLCRNHHNLVNIHKLNIQLYILVNNL